MMMELIQEESLFLSVMDSIRIFLSFCLSNTHTHKQSTHLSIRGTPERSSSLIEIRIEWLHETEQRTEAHVCETIDRQFLTWRSRCSSHTCRFRNPTSSMLRKRIESAIEEIDVLSAIPPTARNVLKLPSGVILRAITVEIIFACFLSEVCRTLHFANSLSEGIFNVTPLTLPYIFLFH